MTIDLVVSVNWLCRRCGAWGRVRSAIVERAWQRAGIAHGRQAPRCPAGASDFALMFNARGFTPPPGRRLVSGPRTPCDACGYTKAEHVAGVCPEQGDGPTP